MQAAADEVRKKEEEHEQMLQRVRDSLPPEPENGSPGLAHLQTYVQARVRERKLSVTGH